MDTIGRPSFRRLTEADLPLIHRWLNLPHVLEWWDRPGPSLDEVRAKYVPRLDDDSDVTPYVIHWDDVPIGYIQRYPVHEGAWGLRNVGTSVGIDLFIGHARYLGRGLGTQILRAFLREIVFQNPAVDACFIDPSPRNAVAIRAFEKAGFRDAGTGVDADTGAEVRLMKVERGG